MIGSPLYQQLRAQLAEGVRFLADKPEETPDSTLHALWHLATGQPLSPQLALGRTLPALDADQVRNLEELVSRRMTGTPLSHLTQRQHFMGLEMLAGPQALTPRAETELLARVAIAIGRDLSEHRGPITAVDVCTGSGNVALAVAKGVPHAFVHAADLSEDAVALARRNAQFLNLEDRVAFRAGDLLCPFETQQFLGTVDLLTCNPPYISSAKVQRMPEEIARHEPHLAFDGGPLGVTILMRLVQQAPRFLRPGAWLAFEVGLGQGPPMLKRLQSSAAFTEVRPHTDANEDIRVIAARCASSPT